VLTKKRQHIFGDSAGKKDQVGKTVQSNLSQMGARCDLDMNNIVTTSLQDLPPEM
jgi:hypothetical protein